MATIAEDPPGTSHADSAGSATATGPIHPAACRAVLVATILASSMVFIDSSAVNVALPALQQELGATAGGAQWVVESYLLFLSALLLLGGVLGDRFGRKRVFLIGTVLFAAASIACGLAPTTETLIAARGAQGIAAALLTPASLAIITVTFADDAERGRAIGLWSGFTAITSAAGPVLGGWLVENLSWRWVFFINLPLAIVVVLVALRGMPESRNERAGRLDLPGAALATVGLGALVFGLIEAPVRGWGDGLVMAGLAGGALALALFALVEMRSPSPMLPPALFRSRTFAGANVLTLLLYGAFGGALFWLPFNLIQVQGYSATAAGAALLPAILLLSVLSRWTGGLAGGIGPRLPLTVGPAIVAVAFGLFARPGTDADYWTGFFPAAVVLGIGMAITVPPLTTAVMGAAPREQAGTASGVNNAVARTAGLVAVAVFGVVVAAAFGRELDARLDAIPGLSPEARTAVEAQRADLAATRPPGGAPPEVAAAVEGAIDAAFVDGFRLAMLVGAAMTLLGAAIAWWLIEPKPAAGATIPATPGAGRKGDPSG